jgi:hypothetical protein
MSSFTHVDSGVLYLSSAVEHTLSAREVLLLYEMIDRLSLHENSSKGNGDGHGNNRLIQTSRKAS